MKTKTKVLRQQRPNCQFCGKDSDEACFMVATESASICNECLNDAMAASLKVRLDRARSVSERHHIVAELKATIDSQQQLLLRLERNADDSGHENLPAGPDDIVH